MTRRRSVVASLIPALLLLFGFLPLIFSEFNNLGTISTSLLLTLSMLVIVLGCAFILLLIFKKRTINNFKHFNYEMSGIYGEVEGSMDQFAKYLTHAKSFMKEYAALNACDDQQQDVMLVFKKHEIDIENHIKDIMVVFSGYVDEGFVSDEISEPYSFDFTKPINYSYEMPYHIEGTRIDYLQNGNGILLPVDFIKSLRLKREELYD